MSKSKLFCILTDHPIWYATFKLYCPFEQGFRIWSSTMVSFGYLFLILNIRILINQINFSKEGKIIRFLVIVAILAAYSLPFLMTSFRTFISFNVLGFLILTDLYKLKLNFYIRVALVTFVLGFHPFPAFFLIIFYLIFKRSLVFCFGNTYLGNHNFVLSKSYGCTAK